MPRYEIRLERDCRQVATVFVEEPNEDAAAQKALSDGRSGDLDWYDEDTGRPTIYTIDPLDGEDE